MHKQFPAEFPEVMRQYEATSKSLGHQHPYALRLLQVALQLAPSFFLDELHSLAKEMDLIPEPCAIDDAGQKYYSLDAMAEKLGESANEVPYVFRLPAGRPHAAISC